MKRKKFSVRKKTNSKRKSVMERFQLLAGWHRRLRARLNESLDDGIYGAFDLEHRFNVDQVRLCLVLNAGSLIVVARRFTLRCFFTGATTFCCRQEHHCGGYRV
jgi:hypothetical protein